MNAIKIFLLFHVLSISLVVEAQIQNSMYHFWAFGFGVKNNGFIVNGHFEKTVRNKIQQTFDLELTTLKHPKETKYINTNLQNSGTFVFGKLNNAFPAHLYFGYQKRISNFTERERIGLNVGVKAGPIFCFKKPIYLVLNKLDSNNFLEFKKIIKYENEPNTSINEIISRADWRDGNSEISISTGLSLVIYSNVTWAYFENYPKNINFGFKFDFYPKAPILMLYNADKHFYTSFFLTFNIGKLTAY